jgi:hypothetical protein
MRARSRAAATLALVALFLGLARCDDASCAASDAAGPGAVAMLAELDAMASILSASRTAARDLERLVDAQSARLETMRALAAKPGVSCDEAVAAAERLAAALATPPGRRARDDACEYAEDDDAYAAEYSSSSSSAVTLATLRRRSASASSGAIVPASPRVRAERAVTKRRDVWPDHLRLIAAVRLDAEATALATMPQRGEWDHLPRYHVVGDAAGVVRALRPDGDLAFESDPGFGTPVTAIATTYVRKNETLVVAGHACGRVAFHQIFESDLEASGAGVVIDDVHALAATVFAVRDLADARAEDAVGRSEPAKPATRQRGADRDAIVGRVQPQGRKAVREKDGDESSEDDDESSEASDESSEGSVPRGVGAIIAVETYRVDNKRFVAVADAGGKIAVYGDRGATLHAVYRSVDGDPVVAFKPSRRGPAWLTRRSGGSADLKTHAVRHARCAGLNDTVEVTSATFDVAAGSKFYATSASGELLTGFASLDAPRLACALRNRRTLALPPDSRMAAVKGYVFVATGYEAAVFNVTAAGRKPPADVTVAGYDRLAAAFGADIISEPSDEPGGDEGAASDVEKGFSSSPSAGSSSVGFPRGVPAVGTSGTARGRFVALGLPGGLVATYESELPTWSPSRSASKLWSQPLFVVAMGLIAVYQFYRQKNGGGFGGGGMGGGMGFGERGGGGLDRATLAQLRAAGVDPSALGDLGGGGGGGGGGAGSFAKRSPGYSNFDPAAFRRQMESSGKWRPTQRRS